MVSFQEVRGSKKSTCIAQQILACIRRRECKSGDRLPPERIIAEQMSVSRNAVREALSALKVLGIIESRHGNGTYISSPVDGNPGIGQVLLSVKESEDLFDLWEAREEIEVVIIRIAIRSATEKTIARVSYYLEKMNRAIKVNDTIEYIALDKKFHLSIARGTDNNLLKNIIQPLTLITNDYLLENIDVDRPLLERCKESLEEHKAIFSAINNRDEVAGIKAVRTHYENVKNYFGKKLW